MNLAELRSNKQLSQQNVADAVGITRAAYTNIESGKRRPSPRTAKRIAEALGFDWTRFFDERDNDSEPGEDVEKAV